LEVMKTWNQMRSYPRRPCRMHVLYEIWFILGVDCQSWILVIRKKQEDCFRKLLRIDRI
jgi:hypothetical protein